MLAFAGDAFRGNPWASDPPPREFSVGDMLLIVGAIAFIINALMSPFMRSSPPRPKPLSRMEQLEARVKELEEQTKKNQPME